MFRIPQTLQIQEDYIESYHNHPPVAQAHVDGEPEKQPAQGTVNLWDYNAPKWGSVGKVEIFNIEQIGCSMKTSTYVMKNNGIACSRFLGTFIWHLIFYKSTLWSTEGKNVIFNINNWLFIEECIYVMKKDW